LDTQKWVWEYFVGGCYRHQLKLRVYVSHLACKRNLVHQTYRNHFVLTKPSWLLQGGEGAQDALGCTSLLTKAWEPLTIGHFCGKRPIKMRHPLHLYHPVGRSNLVLACWGVTHQVLHEKMQDYISCKMNNSPTLQCIVRIWTLIIQVAGPASLDPASNDVWQIPPIRTIYDSFHWKWYTPEIHQIEKPRFLGISRCKFKFKFCLNLNLYREFSRFSGFWERS